MALMIRARQVHQRLVDAIDVIPEELRTSTPKTVRHVEQRYAEIYAGDALVVARVSKMCFVLASR